MNVTGWFSGTTGSVPAGFLVAPSHELIGMTLGGVIKEKWSAYRIENGDVQNGHVQSTMESTPLWAKSCF